jgi:hypothetical protein
MDNIEFARAKIIGKLLRYMRAPGTIQNIDLNSFAFSDEHIGTFDFAAHGMRKNPRNKFAGKQRDK